jgi:hypothetical protein
LKSWQKHYGKCCHSIHWLQHTCPLMLLTNYGKFTLYTWLRHVRRIFFYALFSEPSDIQHVQKWWFGIKIKFYYFYFLPFSRPPP